ncbi:DUF58 domain-containing protein [Piscinibacter koreensis]|uniref:DUF58 domain-containing protein n=1 Tax=Piscinibacter koreensis TaxID=2742824 RepID=A0A7Y6NKW7_9BURK|nr:DUF58 domain-containing protein [Schlegelella koreensis]
MSANAAAGAASRANRSSAASPATASPPRPANDDTGRVGARPAALVRQRFRRWWQARVPLTDSQLLTQRNVYILPTRAGFMFALTLVVLLLASINYQLNLGYLLTFLLAGSGIVSMHLTHATLRGLTLHLRPVAPAFAGAPAVLDVVLSSPDRERFGIGLRVLDAPLSTLSWIDVPARGQAALQLRFVPEQRGLQQLPALTAETRFPLGLFRAWTVWRPASRLLVYPRIEADAPKLPAARALAGGPGHARQTQGGEIEGVRAYRRGDPLKLVAWKKAAQALETGSELVSRDTSASARHELWLDWADCAGLAPEARLSRLTAWTLAATRAGADYGLRLPGREIAPDAGDVQRRRCLEALALWA